MTRYADTIIRVKALFSSIILTYCFISINSTSLSSAKIKMKNSEIKFPMA